MRRVLLGAIACLALASIQGEECTSAPAGASAGQVPLTINVSSSTSTGQAGSKTIKPYSIKGTRAFDEVDVKQLASGDNSFAVPKVPTPPAGCVLVPPPSNDAALTLKGSESDKGLRISKTDPTLIVFDNKAVPDTIIVNSSSAFPAGQVLTITWF